MLGILLRLVSLLSLCAWLIACSDSSSDRVAPLIEPEPEPPVALQTRYTLSSPDSVPEGITFDTVERAFYVSSFNGASITRIDADGTETVFREADNRAALLGMKIDANERRLWVCARDVDGMDDRVWVFDLAGGAQIMEFQLIAISANGGCNDLALDDEGIAYVSDSFNPNVYRLDPNTELGSLYISDPALSDVAAIGLGGNGIAISDSQDSLLVSRGFPAQIVRIDLPTPDTVTVISVTGDTLGFTDGMVFFEDDLYTVNSQTVGRIQFDDSGDGTLVSSEELVPGPSLTTNTVAEGMVYVIKSDVLSFIGGGELDLPFEFFAIDLEAYD